MVEESPPTGSVGSVGSVAEETARLLDALFGGESAPARPPSPQPPLPTEEPHPTTRHTEVCGSCGQEVGSETPEAKADPAPSVCHLCPVCQLISAVRSVRPETVDRLADLAAALTQTLREVAATRWAETGQPGAERHRSTVEDIDVHDDDPTDDPTDEETHL
ncbi:hypothetical protein [Lapillicoccus sp.]|uniref:hypothetical protein n=1 Tax=Lapillicoccus sp. TaxID=1909287 RepID=UPI0025E7EEB3|nr:hypothetical protein [Lapillicoccus sp.]